MVGCLDPQLASVCKSEGRSILTLDLDFADIRTYPPREYHGIVLLRPRNQSKRSVIELLEKMLPLLTSETLLGHLWILEETGLRIREG